MADTTLSYPITFRKPDAQKLGHHLSLRHCVELIGLKHVGISNFLEFFLNHEEIVPTYVSKSENHLFVPVDLNDLVEIELFPFWILTFKRLVDAVDSALPEKIKKEISTLFLDSIQSQDLFLTVENLRRALTIIVEAKIMPTFFFIRFDRLKDALTHDFFANLQGLRDACLGKLAYVFTSFRSLDAISPEVFPRKLLSLFSHLAYIKPAQKSDMQVILDSLAERYHLKLDKKFGEKLINLAGGHVQYLQLSVIVASQTKKLPGGNLAKTILADERLRLLSEEITENLTEEEQEILKIVKSGQKIPRHLADQARYLTDTGFIQKTNAHYSIFSPYFAHFLEKFEKNGNATVELTKKEHLLFTFLLKNLNSICDRERIIESVWPEYEELGVSDWTIDRLVARLRTKLKKQKSEYFIETVKTRGYKLIS